MIHLVPIHNPHTIRSLLNKDDIGKIILGLDVIDHYIPDIYTAFFIIVEDDIPKGLWVFKEFNYKLLSFHCAIYKEHRSKNTKDIAKECLILSKKMFPNYSLVTTIPEDYIKARTVIEQLGYKGVLIKNKLGNTYFYTEVE